MSEYVPEGALLPSGINVDETAAYFGITDSSKILMEMENVNRHTSLTMVLNKISDLLLTDTFDLDSGSNRLQVETGEIYYILTGPLELLSITEKLQDFLGFNPEGNTERPNITDEQFSSLESFLDPMNILKVYAIGDVTGGNNELAKYVNAFDSMINNPSENLDNLSQIRKEMTEILTDTKNMQMPRPISVLKSSKSITAPKLIAPQIPVETKMEDEIQNGVAQEEAIVQPELQQPTALKPPTSNQNKVIEATPLAKPERLQKPENIPQKPLPPKQEKSTMQDLEINSLDTNQWVSETPKTKPIESKTIPTPIQPKVEPIIPKTTQIPTPRDTQNKPLSEIPSALPKPRQRSPPKPIINSNTNGIVRTFPSGNICKGCNVSLSNSWRFCPLCGFNN